MNADLKEAWEILNKEEYLDPEDIQTLADIISELNKRNLELEAKVKELKQK